MYKEELIKEMYILYCNELYKIAMNYVHNIEDAKDIIQNVFVKLELYSGTFDSKEGCKAWLIRVTINECKNHLKRWWTKNVEKNDIEKTDLEKLIIYEEKVFENLTSNEILIIKTINVLNEKYKDPLLLLIDGYSYKEISKVLKINESTLRTRIERAKKLLIIKLSEQEETKYDLLYGGRD